MAQEQALIESQRETNALSLADETGVSDIFAYQNRDELISPFAISDPSDITPTEEIELPDLPEIPLTIGPKTKENQGLFERIFGYDPNIDLPWGYERMTPFQRVVLKADLAAQNVFTRIALGATKQLKGTLQLILPESMEQYLPTDSKINEFRLKEDRFYEKRIQSELRRKRDKDKLSPIEEEQLAFLDETLPSTGQRIPEFVGRVTAEIERIALASEVFKAIPLGGGDTLGSHLSEVGRKLLGARLAAKAALVEGRPVATAALNALAKQMEFLGPNIGELFTWGFLAAEKPEEAEGEAVGLTRIEAGTKMSAWAALPLLLVPSVKVFAVTKPGISFIQFTQRVVSKVSGPIADRLAKMQSKKAKNLIVKQGLTEADDLFLQENGRILNSAEKKVMKEVLEEVADETAKIAKQSGDDIVAKIEILAGKELGAEPVGAESVIPVSQRSIETVGDDVINSTTSLVEKRTRFATLRQPDGNYAILDKETLHEVAVGIKRKNIAKELDDLIFGVGGKAPKKLPSIAKKKTPRLIAEEVELRRSLKRMEVATNKAFRAGVKNANEKAAIKIQAGKERLQTIKTGQREQWKNVEFARQLVKDFVPKKDQHLFLNRLIRAKTEGGLDKIFDDIGKHLDKAKVNNSIDSIRSALKAAASKYRDKTGKFAKAPDEIRPILNSLDKSMAGITKLSQEAGTDIGGFTQLADDMVTGLNSALAGKGEVLGIPEGLADDLYSLTIARGEKLTADEIETLANLTRMVIHRAEQSHLIDIGGEIIAVENTISNVFERVVPRKVIPRRNPVTEKFKKLYGVDSDHPITLLEKMFGQGSDMSVLLDDLYEGEIKAFGIMRNSYGIIQDYMRKNNLDDNVFNGLKKKVSVKLGGKDAKLTRDEILGLAMSSRDPWVFDQMTRTVGYKIGGVDRFAATTDELGEMFALLTPEEMKLGAVIFELNNNYLSQIVNEASIRLNGTKLATYPQYYPSHRALNEKLYGNKWAFRTAETQSNFMPRMGGKGRMKFNPFSRELMDYIQNSAMYNGTSAPMRSLKTVLKSEGLQTHIKNSGYSDELSNFTTILSRSEGMYSDSSTLDAIGTAILNRFTKGVLGGRVSTIGTQVGSVPAAKAIIPSKYFKIVDTTIGTKAVDDLMASDFFWYRWTGRRVSVELGDTAAQSGLSHFIFNKTPLTEKPLTGLVWGDKQAIAGKIYPAARRFIADTTKLQGDDLTKAAVKLTEKVTRETQPNWSILTRSKLASDPSVFRRSLTMFRTAQEAQFNIWKRANVKFARSEKKSKDVKELANSYRAVLESQMSVAIWKATWKRGREAGVAGVAGWLGVYTPQDEDPFAEDLTKSAARTIAGTVPLGQLMETAVEAAYDELFNEGARFNLSTDPITTVATTSVTAVNSIAKWTRKYIEAEIKRKGFTADLIPANIDDLLDQISVSEADRAQKKQELKRQITKDVVNALRAAGLVSGAPVGLLDEWIAPGLKRSPFSLVNRINNRNASDPADMQRDLHKFLTLEAKLKKKADKKGLTQEEAMVAFQANLLRTTIIEAAFAVDDVVGDQGDRVLDSISLPLAEFLKVNK